MYDTMCSQNILLVFSVYSLREPPRHCIVVPSKTYTQFDKYNTNHHFSCQNIPLSVRGTCAKIFNFNIITDLDTSFCCNVPKGFYFFCQKECLFEKNIHKQYSYTSIQNDVTNIICTPSSLRSH